MTTSRGILLATAILFLVAMFFFIVQSENGMLDLNRLKVERNALVAENARLARGNLDLSREIDRLENDLRYIEDIARHELGMVAKDELVLKPTNKSGRR